MSDDADDYDDVAVHDNLDHLIVFFYFIQDNMDPSQDDVAEVIKDDLWY